MDVRELFRNLKNPDSKIENDDSYNVDIYGGTMIKIDAATTEETATPQDPVAVPQPEPVKPIEVPEPPKPVEEKPVQVKYFTPRDHRSAMTIVEKLKEGDVVVIDFSVIDRQLCVRLLDYVMGAMQALDCEKVRIDNDHVCIGKSMEDIQRFCENHKDAETEIMDSPDPDQVYED